VYRLLRVGLVFCALATWGKAAQAEPVLQLDIIGGYYDDVTDTIISNGPTFQLVALLTPEGGDDVDALLDDTYYISAAITPQVGPVSSSIGSFTFDGTPVSATSGMNYGTPPLDLVEGHPDAQLGGHGIYPTFYSEFEFQFSAANRATTYNSETDPGGLVTNPLGGSYYALFTVDATALDDGYQLHFDLYNSFVKREAQCQTQRRRGVSTTTCSPEDIGVEDFAPFSHDAESGELTPVPEPATLSLLALGLGASAVRRRRDRNKIQ
jgi:hypothetical protein